MGRVLGAPTLGAVRALRLARSLHSPRGSREEDGADGGRPVAFSSSRASPAQWTVRQSLGGQQQRPWWKVLPFGLSVLLLVSWCFLRPESPADRWLRRLLDGEGPPGDGRGPPGQ
ncbi:protein CCSMST1-like [Ochotona curzoniae]|uniref:protein CCSMST1 n=1 Tax=Ochotona curzoniae TaxID=130825 RepID=UPI001B3499C9|nr:protein CCSMST1 [Ochotona curzoniae]XP_040853452.1 protein CCSMST1-like [Ochotona curzoniae]